MKLPMALLEMRFSNPMKFKKLFQQYLAANDVKISLPKVIAETVYYDQQPLGAAAGITEFFKGAVDPNNTNLLNYQRPESEHDIILGIRLLDAAAATIQDSAWAYGAVAAAVLNGNYSMTINGQKILDKIPGTAHNTNLTTDDQGVIWLSEPAVWLAQTNLLVQFETLSAPVANQNLRIELIGIGLIS